MLTKFRSLSREVVPVHLDGNVSIDPSAAIAPGVLLQAEPNRRITIGAGVCIGAGTILHASGGDLDIGAGVCVGRGVLIIGSGTIDRNTCIGAGSTIFDPHIEEGSVIPTHSVMGDRSRGEVSVVIDPPAPTPPVVPAPSETADIWDSSNAWDTPVAQPPVVETHMAPTAPQTEELLTVTIEIERQSTKSVAGRANFDRLKRHLFPNS